MEPIPEKLSKNLEAMLGKYFSQSFHRFAERDDAKFDAIQTMQDNLQSSIDVIKRVKTEIDSIQPKRILEVGSGPGFLSMAMAIQFEDAKVFGVEPEKSGVDLANSLSKELTLERQVTFQCGQGEALPFDDNTFDLVICHTVIEHVGNVEKVISEISRVLSPNGRLHLEAPNYVFPYEPHLQIYTVPKFGKKFVAFTSFFQGKWGLRGYLEHLQFVTPFSLERLFTKYNLEANNLVVEKIWRISDGTTIPKKYRKLSTLIRLMSYIGGLKLVIALVVASGLYPSVMYSAKKRHEVRKAASI